MDTRSRYCFLFAVLLVVAVAGCSDDSSTTTGGTPPDTTPPSIASVTAVDIGHIDVAFSEDVRRDSAERRLNYTIVEVVPPIPSGNDAATPGDTLRVGAASLGSDNRTVTLSTIDFMNNVSYEMSVNGVSDLSGNTITSPVSSVFTGTSSPDVTPPSITHRTPGPNATGVGVAQPVVFGFSEAVDYSSVVNGISWETTGGGTPVPYQVDSEGYSEYAVSPLSPLATNTQYTFTLTGVTDFYANTMATSSWSFTTSPNTDTTPPTVVSTVPANGATNVNVNINLSITFSEAINQLTLQPQLIPDVGDGVASWSNGGKTVTFDPFLPLATNQAYTLSILPGNMEDLAGNKNIQITTVVFSTGSTLPGGSFAGTLTGDPGTAAADPTGAVVAAADGLIFDNDNVAILGSDVVATNNTYDIRRLPDGVYYPISVMNTNGDNELDPSLGDAVGLYGIDFANGDLTPDSLTISGGNRITGVNFPLIDMSAIAGMVSYSGSYSGGFYDIYVGVFDTAGFDPTQPPDYGTIASWPYDTRFVFNSLDDGLADGQYYVAAFLDVNGNSQYDAGVDPAGAYGGVITPAPLTILNGSDHVGLEIVISDPVTPSPGAAGVTWPAPAKRAPWVKKLSAAIHEQAAMSER